MDLLETYDKNKEKHLLKEVSAGAAVGGFVGRSGMDVDTLFGGGFHPEFGKLKDLLQQQLDDRETLRKWMIDQIGKENVGIDHPLGGYHEIDTPELIATYKYLQETNQIRNDFNREMTPTLNQIWEFVNLDEYRHLVRKRLKYDVEVSKRGEKFISTSSTKMQSVSIDIQYDKIVDNTEKNKKFVNPTNDWKYIYNTNKR